MLSHNPKIFQNVIWRLYVYHDYLYKPNNVHQPYSKWKRKPTQKCFQNNWSKSASWSCSSSKAYLHKFSDVVYSYNIKTKKNGRSILKALHLQYENYDLTNFEGLKFFRKIHTSKQTPPCNIILSSVLMLSKYNIFLLWKLLCFWGLWWLNVVYEFQIIIVIPLPSLRRKYAVEDE